MILGLPPGAGVSQYLHFPQGSHPRRQRFLSAARSRVRFSQQKDWEVTDGHRLAKLEGQPRDPRFSSSRATSRINASISNTREECDASPARRDRQPITIVKDPLASSNWISRPTSPSVRQCANTRIGSSSRSRREVYGHEHRPSSTMRRPHWSMDRSSGQRWIYCLLEAAPRPRDLCLRVRDGVTTRFRPFQLGVGPKLDDVMEPERGRQPRGFHAVIECDFQENRSTVGRRPAEPLVSPSSTMCRSLLHHREQERCARARSSPPATANDVSVPNSAKLIIARQGLSRLRDMPRWRRPSLPSGKYSAILSGDP